MSDQSVKSKNTGTLRLADALLRLTGGCVAIAKIPANVEFGTDAEELGISTPAFQELALSPVTFRRTRPVSQEHQSVKYELLVSASAVLKQVGVLQLDSPGALFEQIASVSVAGLNLLIEEWSCSIDNGQPILYRLLLRGAESLSV